MSPAIRASLVSAEHFRLTLLEERNWPKERKHITSAKEREKLRKILKKCVSQSVRDTRPACSLNTIISVKYFQLQIVSRLSTEVAFYAQCSISLA